MSAERSLAAPTAFGRASCTRGHSTQATSLCRGETGTPGGKSHRAAPSLQVVGWTVSSPPSIACPFSPGALTPARRKAGSADSGSVVGLHTSCPTHRSTSPASQSAQGKQQREGAEGRETEPSTSWAGMQRMPGAFPLPVSPASPAASLRLPQPPPPPFGSLLLSRSRAGRGRYVGGIVALNTPVSFSLFSSQNTPAPRAFSSVRLLVKSNWGKPAYTCIYRVQVHGKMAKPESLN